MRNIKLESDSWVVIPTESGAWVLVEGPVGTLITTPNDGLTVYDSYDEAWDSIPAGKKPDKIE